MITLYDTHRLFRKTSDFLKRELLHRSLPHGRVNPRYLLPGQSRKIRIHRLLWLNGLPQIPFPFYIWMEIFLWLRWTLFSCWRGTFRSVRRLGPKIKDREDIGIFTQFKRVLCMALFHCIPPSEVYAFRLYRTDHRSTLIMTVSPSMSLATISSIWLMTTSVVIFFVFMAGSSFRVFRNGLH